MGSRRDDYDDDDYDRRPRRRPDDYDDDDFYDRPRRRRPRRRRSSGGPSAGKVIAIVVGSLAAVGVLVAIIYMAKNGTFGGGGSMSYEQYAAITEKDTLEGVQAKCGRGTKLDPSEWSRIGPGTDLNSHAMQLDNQPLTAYHHLASEVTSWHRWRQGKEVVYLAEGRDRNGRPGLVIKIYWNPEVAQKEFLNPNAPKSGKPWFEIVQLGVGTHFKFGGN